MIQGGSSASFTGYLEFISESSLSLVGFDACNPKHPIYLFFLSLGVIFRVLIALHFHIAHDITRQLANCDENYKFFIYPYSML